MIETSVMKELSEKNLRKITKKIFENLSNILEGAFFMNVVHMKEIRIEVKI